jgi:hypothetical protein
MRRLLCLTLLCAIPCVGCGGSVRIRPVSSWSTSDDTLAAQAGWFTLTRGAQTVILYCVVDENSLQDGLDCAAHAVSLSGKEETRVLTRNIRSAEP